MPSRSAGQTLATAYGWCENQAVNRLFDDSDADARGSEPQDARMPLAARLRPSSVADFVGQRHLIHEGSPLQRALTGDGLHPMILYGPPGSGKTTIAYLLSANTDAAVERASAVGVGSAEVRAIIERATERLKTSGRQTIFFLDEIHRFNKTQQDVLLAAVEDGLVILVGATTENPYFEVNSALLSRCQIYELEALDSDDIRQLLDRALRVPEGVTNGAAVDSEALDLLAQRAGGDARTALSALELACGSQSGGGHVTVSVAQEALTRRPLLYDKQADQHYDSISAWIKATRGSDPDASLLYLAAMLEGGEDPRFIARRMVILASEDIGNADPRALSLAVATAHAVEHVGLPECAHNLAQATVYLALAPKSNASYLALGRARAHVREHGPISPPAYLRSGARSSGEYVYPHDFADGVSSQSLMPPGLEGVSFLELTDHGAEEELQKRLNQIKATRTRHVG
jgi:putative ATPase